MIYVSAIACQLIYSYVLTRHLIYLFAIIRQMNCPAAMKRQIMYLSAIIGEYYFPVKKYWYIFFWHQEDQRWLVFTFIS